MSRKIQHLNATITTPHTENIFCTPGIPTSSGLIAGTLNFIESTPLQCPICGTYFRWSCLPTCVWAIVFFAGFSLTWWGVRMTTGKAVASLRP